jgi:hypothetical protein
MTVRIAQSPKNLDIKGLHTEKRMQKSSSRFLKNVNQISQVQAHLHQFRYCNLVKRDAAAYDTDFKKICMSLTSPFQKILLLIFEANLNNLKLFKPNSKPKNLRFDSLEKHPILKI